ncbi:putative nucleic acid-binding protein [Salinibacter ruber]|jgi:predicted nucleic acid-binding protein|uniref:PIN-like domain-containing protein n=1 Tax=Salinibacter ruber TaxID=146919 RepID=UPI00162146B3|nr:PIN-like domain-containing protein [Salinibacter ruber]MBB4060065.1 putative nucleic acid-binding protein [Salinibacter ruber]MCS3934646.1 putative nucleic acid-binding protein [Salinibacter ruber]MCS4041730.1 putative nucleic acid-binding protein [Salinibacter ruber]
MREQFPWFFDPTEEELQRFWDEATFSFDANVLLNLYRVDRETTEDYFKIFRAFEDRIFLPHEAANQFFHNRRGVIRTEQNSFSKAKDEVEKWVERRTSFENLKQQLRGGNIGQIIEDEIESVFDGRGDYEEEVEEVKDDLIERIEDLQERFTPTGTTRANAEKDEILGGLIEIFDGKTGQSLEEDVEDLKEKAQKRYESEQPPGYEDYGGDEYVSRGECEDFIIWKQLLVFAEREEEDVVFITGEEKQDWWEVDNEYEIVRPRYELLREFSRRTGQVFWILTTEDMLENAYDRLGVEVRDKSVEQTETVKILSKKLESNYEISIGERIKKLIETEELYKIRAAVASIESIKENISEGNWRKAIETAKEVDKDISDPIASVIVDSERLTTSDAQVIAETKGKAIEAIVDEREKAARSYLSELSQHLNRIFDLLTSD